MASIARICIPAAGGTFHESQEMRTCLMNIEEGRKHKNIYGKAAITALNAL